MIVLTFHEALDSLGRANSQSAAGLRFMPVTPGKSTTTTSPGFNKVVFLWEFCGEQPRGIGGNVPHVFFILLENPRAGGATGHNKSDPSANN